MLLKGKILQCFWWESGYLYRLLLKLHETPSVTSATED